MPATRAIHPTTFGQEDEKWLIRSIDKSERSGYYRAFHAIYRVNFHLYDHRLAALPRGGWRCWTGRRAVNAQTGGGASESRVVVHHNRGPGGGAHRRRDPERGGGPQAIDAAGELGSHRRFVWPHRAQRGTPLGDPAWHLPELHRRRAPRAGAQAPRPFCIPLSGLWPRSDGQGTLAREGPGASGE